MTHPSTAIIAYVLRIAAGSTPAAAIRRNRTGTDRNVSIRRWSTASIQPPKYPAAAPTMIPSATAIPVATNPTEMDRRQAWTS